ncbi:1-acyl-sn-glycerol-3-phosphate acyltransferase [Pseudogemmobacter sp. W21_MBD1_M6]|uniref:1-acyl-sn-glycerol-3-phosphate acyltransferase n=1 Tax=Pseudogemmobacter sp. W21_MBD1_M6 TaxID=3240271 RepID=UPI003F97E0FC
MFRTVELPLWLLVVVLGFAAVTAMSHFLFPSVRWFFRRRMQRAVDRLNHRLQLQIKPFNLARRSDTINRLVYDPKVMEAVVEHARTEGVPENVAFEMAERYAREIVPSFSASVYFGFAIRAAKVLSRSLYRVRLGQYDEAALEAIDRDATVIFVMNHRSNMDYILVTYLVAERSALSFAVGEWARIWPLQQLIRAMGGYFIRRKSRSVLYRRVLARYVQMATDAGVTQAIFPEGGLSLDGRVGAPKLGLLSYILTGFRMDGPRDVVFVPVALNYDKVFEDQVLTDAATKGYRQFRFRPVNALLVLAKQIWLRLRGRFVRFGYASVSFGTPLSLRDYLGSAGEDATEALGETLMSRVRDVVPVLPVPLVAFTLLQEQTPITHSALVAACDSVVQRAKARDAHVYLPRDNIDDAARFGLQALLRRNLVTAEGDLYAPTGTGLHLLRYYANSVEHLLVADAAISTAKPQLSKSLTQ